MMRYVRAFFIALGMTLRGQTPPPAPNAPLRAWLAAGLPLVMAVIRAADQEGLNEAIRKRLMLRIDGRDMSMHTLLAGVEHHLRQEYPYLLQHLTDHSVTAIYASNMNDQYRLMRLRDSDLLTEQAAVREAVARLSEHLNSIPPTNTSQTLK